MIKKRGEEKIGRRKNGKGDEGRKGRSGLKKKEGTGL